jgi:FAD/FMN-containing dehydrogenase
MPETVVPGLERRLKAQLLGEVAFDAFTRGRYATDASHYQIMPIGVVAPSSAKEVEYTLALARDEGVSVTARGGGTSQSGQTVNSTLIVDCSKYLTACSSSMSRASAAWSSPASCSTSSTVA